MQNRKEKKPGNSIETGLFNSEGYYQWIRPQVFYKVYLPNNVLFVLKIIIKSWPNSLYCWQFMSLCDMVQHRNICWSTLHFVIRLNAHHNAFGNIFSSSQMSTSPYYSVTYCPCHLSFPSPNVCVTITFCHQVSVSPSLSVTSCQCHQMTVTKCRHTETKLSKNFPSDLWLV